MRATVNGNAVSVCREEPLTDLFQLRPRSSKIEMMPLSAET